MRYIKEYVKVDYQEITSDEYYKMIPSRIIKFNRMSALLVKQYITSIYPNITMNIDDRVLNIFDSSNRGCPVIIISEVDDEWFYVKVFKRIRRNSVNNTYYKCDQFEELMDCLHNIYE